MTRHPRIVIWLCVLTMALSGLTLPGAARAGEAAGPDLVRQTQNLLENLRGRALSLRAGLEDDSLDAEQRAGLEPLIGEIQVNHLLLTARFEERADQSGRLGPEARDRHLTMLAGYRQVVPAVLAHARAIRDNDQPAEHLEALVKLLRNVLFRPARPVYGLLPVRTTGYGRVAPALTPEVLAAYQGGQVAVGEEDTAPCPEAPRTEPIAELARSLDWNPVQIYEYVKNEIKTEFYYGCMKGAADTLRQKSGNDADQAALLVALFRAAGYPARYVRGAITFFPGLDQAREHYGVEEIEQAGRLLHGAGVPFEYVYTAGGRIDNLRVEHVWVEVRVPYGHARGADPGEGDRRWIALDTAIKPAGYQQSRPLDPDLDLAGLAGDYLARFRPETPREYLAAQVEESLEQQGHPQAGFDETLLTRTLQAEHLDLLPPRPQFRVTAMTGEYTRLPDDLLHTARFLARPDLTGAEPFFEVTLPTHELSNQQILLTYEPETVEDQEIINSYGGLDNTPAYLVRLRPVLQVDGRRRAVGADGLAAGESFCLTTTFISPRGETQPVDNTRLAGNLAAISIVAQEAVLPAPMPDKDKNAGRLMWEVAAGYIDRWNRSEADLAGLLRRRITRPVPAMATVGGQLAVDYLLNQPHATTWKGLYLDADLRAVYTAAAGTVPFCDEPNRTFLDLLALEGSRLEDRTLEAVLGVDSLSTAELFMQAHDQGVALLEMDAENIDTLLPQLTAADSIKTSLENAVLAQGRTAQIPQTPLTCRDWTGTGYIVRDPLSGESGWMLSGDIAGGMTVLNPDNPAWGDWRGAFANLFGEPPNPDPTAAYTIAKVPGSLAELQDRRLRVGEEVPLQVKVTDLTGRPVRDVEVTFDVKAGGGTLPEGNTAFTGDDGLAAVTCRLGEQTGRNPRYLKYDAEQAYFTRAGGNLIDAHISGTAIYLDSPFDLPAFPGEPDHVRTIPADRVLHDEILSYAGFVKVYVEDRYGNPVPNQAVNFAATVPDSDCVDPAADNRAVKFLSYEEALDCLDNGYPGYDRCGQAGEFARTTDTEGAATASLIAGAVPAADYTITAGIAGLAPVTFTLTTAPVGDCAEGTFPGSSLQLGYFYASDDAGNQINAGAPGDTIDLRAYMRLLAEESRLIENVDCDGHSCDQLVGTNTYTVRTDFEADSGVSFDGHRVEDAAGGYYTYPHTITPGVNTIDLDFDAIVAQEQSIPRLSCSNCDIRTEKFPYTASGQVKVYGVEAQFVDPEQPDQAIGRLYLPVNENGALIKDAVLTPEITPSEYIPLNAQVVIYQDDQAIDYLPTAVSDGRGSVTLSRGSRFDLDKNYQAGLLLNNGAGEPLCIDMPAEDRLEISPVYIDRVLIDKHPVVFGETAVLTTAIAPAEYETDVSYEVIEQSRQDLDFNFVSSGGKGILKVGEESPDGWIKVRAFLTDQPEVYQDVSIDIGCPSCAAQDGTCSSASLGSIDFTIGLGPAAAGEKSRSGIEAGKLILRSDQLTQDIYSPGELEFSGFAQGVRLAYDNDGALTRVMATRTTADIVVPDENGYEIRLYHTAEFGPFDRPADNITAEPFAVWSIRNPDADPTVSERLRITETRQGSVTSRYEYRCDADGAWSLSKGGGLTITSRRQETDANGDRVEIETVTNGDGTIASVTRTTWHEFDWGESVVKKEIGSGEDTRTTRISYYRDPDAPDDYGHVKQRLRPDGSWTRYHYDSRDRVVREISSWLDQTATAEAVTARVTEYDYTPVDPDDAQAEEDAFRPRTVTETVAGVAVSRTYHAYLVDGDGGRTIIEERCANPAASYGSPDNQRTTTVYHPRWTGQAGAGQVARVTHPDDRRDTYAYEYGQWSGDSFQPGAGEQVRRTVTHGTGVQPAGIEYKSTREVIVRDEVGRTIREETRAYDGSAYLLIQYSDYTHDDQGRVITVVRSDGTRTDTSWGCCSKEWEQDRQGVERVYEHDLLGRLASVARLGRADRPDMVTSYTYDAAGRRLTETRSAGSLSQSSTTAYDTAGRVSRTVDPAGLTTTYDYADGGRITTVTRPTGTEITARYIDGRVKSVTGTAVIPKYYYYGVDPDGTQWTKVHTGAPDSALWEKTYTDALGRTIQTEKPGFTGDIEITRNVYNERGQLVRTTAPGRADILYAYDELGSQVMTGLDVDGNGELLPASADRISGSQTVYTEEGGDFWQKTTRTTYAAAGSPAPTVLGTQMTRLTGLGSGLISQTRTRDIHGNTTETATTLDRAAATRTRTVDYPDSDTDAVSVTVNGLLMSATGKTGLTTTYAYDALGRRTGVTDPRTGTTVTHYNDNHRVDYVQDPAGHRTTYTYDPATGRKMAETNANGQTTYYAYNPRGQVTRTWGAAVYPVQYVYDDYGRMTEMHTYRAEAGWDSDTWPGDASPDITRWHYDPASGLLEKKEDAAGQQVTYTYGAGGRLSSRTWARLDNNQPLLTTYTYDPATAELLAIDYSDDTPGISFTYNRLGQQTQITDAVGSRTLDYNDALQRTTETIDGLYDKTITRTYADTGMIGRDTGFTLGEDTMTYGYDSQGRFKTAAWDINGQTGTVTYSYVPDSELVAGYTTADGQVVSYTYEDHRDLKTTVDNAHNTSQISRYTYAYDELGRRTSVKNSGQAFTDDAFNKYNYNTRNEVTGAGRYLGADVDDLSAPVEPDKRLYQYDPIGNRETSTEGLDPAIAYTANSLNQYTAVSDSSLVYDADGNLTGLPAAVIPASAEIQSSTGWELSWNAENRLTAVAPAAPTAGDTKVAFTYDYLGRRVKKTVYAYDAATPEWTETSTTLFVYDGWNLIQTLDESGAVEKFYAWGLDLSGSLQGAGGVGGLLAMTDGTDTYRYCYDANGNVGQMVDAADGTIVAAYEYDPFGKLTSISGDLAEENPFRFSTKYWDGETGLYYYGYRYYSAELGRWLSRDPIGEEGGLNLYGFVSNDPINRIDIFGLLGNCVEAEWLSDPSLSDVTHEKTGKMDIAEYWTILPPAIGLEGNWYKIRGHILGTVECTDEYKCKEEYEVKIILGTRIGVGWGITLFPRLQMARRSVSMFSSAIKAVDFYTNEWTQLSIDVAENPMTWCTLDNSVNYVNLLIEAKKWDITLERKKIGD